MSKRTTKRLTLSTLVLRQTDLCHAMYALYLASENERDAKKKAALIRVKNALGDITNWTNVEAIASDSIVGDMTDRAGEVAERIALEAYK